MTKAGGMQKLLMAPGATALLVLCGAAVVNAVQPENMIATDGKISIVDGKHIQEITRDFPFEPGQSFALTNENGSITLEGWDEDRVLITAEKRLEKRVGAVGWVMSKLNIDFKTTDDMTEYFDKVDVEVGLSEGGVEIDTIRPKDKGKVNVSVYYDVKVPRDSDVILRTSNGKIILEDINGAVELRSSNGRVTGSHIVGSAHARSSNGTITLTDVTGPVETQTANGSITVEHPEPLSAGSSIACSTSNGSVRVHIAKGSAFDIAAKTRNGRIRTDFDVNRTDKKPSQRYMNGTVNGGGPLLDLSTTNGSISVNSDLD